MDRRGFLAASSAIGSLGILGCVGSPGSDPTETGYDLAVEQVSATGAVRLEARVERHITDEHPGVLSMALTNGAAEERTFWYIGGTMVPFNQVWLARQNGEGRVVLLATGLVADERHNGCWVGYGDDDVRRHATLAPDETLAGEVAVVAGAVPIADEDPPEPCYRTGTYAGEQTLELYDSDDDLERYGEPQTEKVEKTTFRLELAFSE